MKNVNAVRLILCLTVTETHRMSLILHMNLTPSSSHPLLSRFVRVTELQNKVDIKYNMYTHIYTLG